MMIVNEEGERGEAKGSSKGYTKSACVYVRACGCVWMYVVNVSPFGTEEKSAGRVLFPFLEEARFEVSVVCCVGCGCGVWGPACFSRDSQEAPKKQKLSLNTHQTSGNIYKGDI